MYMNTYIYANIVEPLCCYLNTVNNIHFNRKIERKQREPQVALPQPNVEKH